uniref:Putative UDP-N-acetylglucosamine 2-epimerase n=1 Tax=viral metagenome TaxID=1070528 RepID=A0A6M3J3P8_9ZZZZ
MKELQMRDDVEADWFEVTMNLSSPSICLALGRFSHYLDVVKPNIIVTPCDRFEMVYLAAYAFHTGYFIFHLHAGNNLSNHMDDLNRRVISAFSHVMFANMPEHKENLIRQGEEAWRIRVVGSTAFDVGYDYSVVPGEPFSLVILHPDLVSSFNTDIDIGKTVDAILETEKTVKTTIWIYPNHDKNFELIEQHLAKVKPNKRFFKYENLPREQYMALLNKCAVAIGNSSSFYYELPVVNPKARLIQIGERNRGLVVPKTVTGGSRRIATILATISLNEKLYKKWVNQK